MSFVVEGITHCGGYCGECGRPLDDNEFYLCSSCDNKKIELCPVCNGRGKVAEGFYSGSCSSGYYITASTGMEECRSCNGKGYIERK